MSIRGMRCVVCVAVFSTCVPVDGPEGSPFVVVDSAGIEIVTSYAPSWSPDDRWRIADRALLTIGTLDGPVESSFGSVSAVGWLEDGRIFVGDELAHAIRIFSSDGKYLETIGREGEGPGELQWFSTVAPYRGDSLFVYDYAQLAVTVFGPDLAFARRFPNPAIAGNYWVVSALADGRFLMFSGGRSRFSGGPGLVPDSSLIIISTPDGSSTDTIGAFQRTVRYVGPDGRPNTMYLAPWGRVTGGQDRVLQTEGKTFEYVEYEPGGTVRRIVRKSEGPVPVTDEIINAFRDHWRSRLSATGVPGGMERVRRAFEEAEYYHQLPAISADLKVDALGHTWVGRYRFRGLPTNQWEVFNLSGVWLGSVETPSGLEVHAIEADRIIGVMTDDLDVPYVQIHALDRR